jgi:hypothetical protein
MIRMPLGKAVLIGTAVIGVLALLVRLAHFESVTPWYDDFYHLLAARHWLQDGTFAIEGGVYSRAPLYTRLVAEALRLFGDTIAAGRVPAVIAGTLWAVAVFVWTRRVSGAIAAWTAGLLLAIDPGAINLSQWVRFYTLHGLLVWVGAVCGYQMVVETSRWPRKALLGGTALIAFLVASLLQETTIIAIGGFLLWAGLTLLPRIPAWLQADRPRRRAILAAGVLLALAAAAWFVASGRAGSYWRTFQTIPFWMEPGQADPRWFLWWLAGRFGILWVLFPLAVVLAVVRYPRPALFAVTMFLTGLAAVSLGTNTAERYLYFALPFFFVLWGMALATLVPAIRLAGEQAATTLRFGARARKLAGVGFLTALLGFAVLQTETFRIGVRMVFPGSAERPYREADWNMVLPRLRSLVDSADVVLSSYVLKPLYYFDRGDAHFSWTETAEAGFVNGHPVEFARDYRTGLPTMSSAASLERVMSCYGSGLVLTERFHLDRAHLLNRETTAFLRAHTDSVPLPADSWVLAFRWRHSVPANQPGCPPWR